MALNTVDKQQLRKKLLQQRKEMPCDERNAIDAAISQKVTEMEVFQRADTIFVYWSVDEEIDTHKMIHAAWRLGKRVCVPKCLKGHQMEARQIFSEADFTEESFGIPEPGSDCAVIPPEEIQLCIIPALACDRTGARLGYGGGFYDRFLSKTPAYKLVLCAQSRILDTIPVQPHDILCSCILTEDEVIEIHER